MKKLLIFVAILGIVTAHTASAKSNNPKGLASSKGTFIEVTDTAYRPVSITSPNSAEFTLESIPGLITLKIKPYRPWYSFGSFPQTSQIELKGLVPNKTYHLYENQYTKHTELTADTRGSVKITIPLGTRNVSYITELPSTNNIYATGSGCVAPKFTWTASTKTCKLLQNLSGSTETIVIHDPGITLDGNGKTLTGAGGNNGISYDNSTGGTTIKNITVRSFSRGISIDSSGSGTLISG